jgi:hypothetical protein
MITGAAAGQGEHALSMAALERARRSRSEGGQRMLYRSSICAIALIGAFCVTIAGASAWDDSKYPDFSGQWRPIGGPGRFARDQKAPLTPEYQAIFEADESEGGQSFQRGGLHGERGRRHVLEFGRLRNDVVRLP